MVKIFINQIYIYDKTAKSQKMQTKNEQKQ